MVRAGLLRHRVTIQERASGADDWGQPGDTWNDVDTVWAEVRDLFGREFLEARQAPGGVITTHVRIRYRDDVTRLQRVIHGSRILDIVVASDPDGRRERLQLECEEAS